MSIDTAKLIADRIKEANWNSRIEFAMHGEPSLNPNFIDIIKIFRKRLPWASIMMTSNGIGFLKPKNIYKAFSYGLNILALDQYKGEKIVDGILLLNDFRKKLFPELFFYPDNKKASPHTRRKPSDRHLVVIRDISEQTYGTHSHLSNHCGCAFPLSNAMDNKRCAKPFREMSIRWDGNVALCCDDFRGIYKCGNIVNYDGIDDLWNNKYFKSARKFLYHGLRKQMNGGVCLGCTTRSYRVGLLPDKLGKKAMSKPTMRDVANVRIATKGKPYTEPVQRPWEEK